MPQVHIVSPGPKLGFYARPIVESDLMNFAAAMADWPRDHEGVFGLTRSTKVVAKHSRHSREFYYPLRDDSRFNLVWCLIDPDGNWCGYWRFKINGKNVHLGQVAVHPDQRGKGYNRIMGHIENYLVWHVFDADLYSGELMDFDPRTKNQMDKNPLTSWTSVRQGSTGRIVSRWEITKEQNRYNDLHWTPDPKDVADGLFLRRLPDGRLDVASNFRLEE